MKYSSLSPSDVEGLGRALGDIEAHARDDAYDPAPALRRLVETLAADIPQMTPDEVELTHRMLQDIHSGYKAFRGTEKLRKFTVFGSARIAPESSGYRCAAEFSRIMTYEYGWGLIQGGGPGIMQAARDSAHPELSFSVPLELPFEKHATLSPGAAMMRLFAPRKLALVRPTSAVVAFPGGLGTLDELFEVLTLVQTGKGRPMPIVLADGGPDFKNHWQPLIDWMDEATDKRLISPNDRELLTFASSPEEIAEQVTGYYRNYHSRRWIERPGRDDLLIVRSNADVTSDDLDKLNQQFDGLATEGAIRTLTRSEAREYGESSPNKRLVLVPDTRRLRHVPHIPAAVNSLESIGRLHERLWISSDPRAIARLSATTDGVDCAVRHQDRRLQTANRFSTPNGSPALTPLIGSAYSPEAAADLAGRQWHQRARAVRETSAPDSLAG